MLVFRGSLKVRTGAELLQYIVLDQVDFLTILSWYMHAPQQICFVGY